MSRLRHVAIPLCPALAMALVGSGCAEGTRERPAFEVRHDTVDAVVYVRHAGSPPAVSLEPLATVGRMATAAGEPSAEEFGRVESVMADDRGQIYVADGFAMEIRTFGPNGEFLRRIGRKGQGPGELEGIHGTAWLTADTMVVMDYGNARLSLMTSTGGVAGQWPWMRLTGSARFLFNGAPGEVYAHTFRSGLPGEELSRSAWVRYTTSGPQDTLDIPSSDPRPGTSAICRGDGIGFFENPFGARHLSRPAPNRERVVAWSSDYRLAFIDSSGDSVRVVTRDVEPMPLADSLWTPVEAEYSDFRSAWAGADCDGGITRPAFRPVLLDVVFDDAGRMLVEYMSDAGPTFDLFGLDGVLLATFPSLAERDPSVVPALRGDRLYLVTKDDLDVQRVHAYRVEGMR